MPDDGMGRLALQFEIKIDHPFEWPLLAEPGR